MQQAMKHGTSKCKTIEAAEFRAWRRKVQFSDYSCCWECGLLQSWCNKREDGLCRWPNIVLLIAKRASQSVEMQGIIWMKFKVNTANEEEWVLWLGRRRQIRGELGTNAIAAFEAIIQHITLSIEEI